MPDDVLHPTPQELTAFALGKLPERAAAVVAAHLEKCSACRQFVAGVSSYTFLDKVRAAGPAGSSFPPSLAQPAMPTVLTPDIPPELVRHPKYLILRELNRGGMGVVYQARQTVMNRQVVIKVINRALLEQPGMLERFHREIRAAAQLSHPNIVTAYDAEQSGELHMLVMEFVPGQSLAEILGKKGPLPVVHACHAMRQAASGLQHAHERNMVHRDIKPSNLIRMPKGQVKILDFGLAKIISESGTRTGITATGDYMGTPDYCAPEQSLDAAKADIRADIYSLGCTLYCLLAGRPPFQEDTAMKTVLAHMQKQPQPLTELRPDVPERLWRVIARLLAKEPIRRYQKPSEVALALAPFIKSSSKDGSAPAAVVGSPVKGTVIETDSEIKKIQRKIPDKTPPKEVPAKEETSPLANRVDAPAKPKKAKEATESTKRLPAVRHPYWLVLAGMGIVLLALVGMWKGGFFTGKTPESVSGLDVWRKELSHPDASVRRNAAMELGRMGAEAHGAVAELVQRLQEDKEASVREAAASAIGDIASALKGKNEDIWKESGSALVKLLKEDASEQVRGSAAHALGAFGPQAAPAAENLIKALDDEKASVRQNAAQALGRIGEDAGTAVPKLCACLKDKNALVRREAAAALGSMGKAAEKAGKPLIELVKSEPDTTVKKKALESLVRIAGPEQADSAKDLIPLLKGEDPFIRLNTALVLARIGGESVASALPLLIATLKDTDKANRELAAASLSTIGQAAKPAMFDLAEALDDKTNSIRTRCYAGLALAHIGADAEPVVPTVVKALERTQPQEVRHFAAEALSSIKYPANKKAVPALLDAIANDTDKEVRLRCVFSLFRMDKSEFLESGASRLLTKVLDERSEDMALVRYSAARKLVQILREEAPDKTADVLLEMLKNKHLRVYHGTDARVEGGRTDAQAGRTDYQPNLGVDARFMAADALGWLGKKASSRPDVVKALRDATKDSDKKLRESAIQALKDVGVH